MVNKYVKPGTQIVYIPNHANGNPQHLTAEYGFVTSVNSYFVFCRFWLTDKNHKPINELRTKGGSAACNMDNLLLSDTVPQSWVAEAWKTIADDYDPRLEMEALDEHA